MCKLHTEHTKPNKPTTEEQKWLKWSKQILHIIHKSNSNQTRSPMRKWCQRLGKVLQLMTYTLVIQKYISESDEHINKHLTKSDTDYA